MPLVNHAKREINAKIVFFGPAGSGKGTALKYIYNRIKPELRREFKSMTANGDTLLFFDFIPYENSTLNGYKVRFHIYTIQGAVNNPANWRMTLKGVDGLALMIDPSIDCLQESRESMENLREYLSSYGNGICDIPAVLLLNKCDLRPAPAEAEILPLLDLQGISGCPVSALNGTGLLQAVSDLSRKIMISLREELSGAPELPENEAVDYTDTVGTERESDSETPLPGTASPEAMESPFPMEECAPLHPEEAPEIPELDAGRPVRTADGRIAIPLSISSNGTERKFVLTVSLDEA